jgi:hypothetical protein
MFLLKLCIKKEMVGYGADEKLWVFQKNYSRAQPTRLDRHG